MWEWVSNLAKDIEEYKASNMKKQKDGTMWYDKIDDSVNEGLSAISKYRSDNVATREKDQLAKSRANIVRGLPTTDSQAMIDTSVDMLPGGKMVSTQGKGLANITNPKYQVDNLQSLTGTMKSGTNYSPNGGAVINRQASDDVANKFIRQGQTKNRSIEKVLSERSNINKAEQELFNRMVRGNKQDMYEKPFKDELHRRMNKGNILDD